MVQRHSEFARMVLVSARKWNNDVINETVREMQYTNPTYMHVTGNAMSYYT
jgi:hypothetical protein